MGLFFIVFEISYLLRIRGKANPSIHHHTDIAAHRVKVFQFTIIVTSDGCISVTWRTWCESYELRMTGVNVKTLQPFIYDVKIKYNTYTILCFWLRKI